MADFTLSGAVIFEGSNPLDVSVTMSASFPATTFVVGEMEGVSALEGSLSVAIGEAETAGAGLLDVAPAFPAGVLRVAFSSFDFLDVRLGAVAEFGGALDYTDDSTGEVHSEIGALPITSDVTLVGSLVADALVSGMLEGEAEFDGGPAGDHFIGNADSPGNEFLDVTPTLTGDTDTDILQSPPYAHFDGVDDYLFVADTADAALNGGAAFSVAFVFDPEVVNNGASGTVLGKHDPTSTNHGWRVEWDVTTGLVTAHFASNLDGSNTASRPNATAIRVRTAVVITYDGTTINIYLTGVGVDNGTQTGTAGNMVTNAAEFALGAHDTVSGADNHFRGAINGVWVWDVVLSSGEAATVDPYGQFDVPQVANLQAAWSPWALHSTGFNTFFANWIDSEGDRPLQPAPIAAGKPLVLPSDLTEQMLFADRWDTDFVNIADLYGADQNLASNYPLASSATDASENGRWRIFTPPTFQNHPEVASGYRDFRNDITIFVRIRNPLSLSNDIVLIEALGLRLFYETLTGELYLFIGDVGTPTRHRYAINFPFGNGRVGAFALRYNAVTEQFSLMHNGDKVLPISSSVTGSAASGTGLQLCDNADYGDAFVIAACLPDLVLTQVLNGFQGDLRSWEFVTQHWRLSARREAIPGLIWGSVLVPSNVALPQEGGTEPDLLYIALAATGTLELSAQPSDGDRFRLDDGDGTAVIFEFDNNASVGAGATGVTIGGTVGATMDNLVAAVNGSALSIGAAVRSDFDATGDGTPSGAYTVLTHDTVPSDPFDRSTEVAIQVTVNASGSLIASGMARALASVDRYELIQRAIFDVRSSGHAVEDFWPYSDAPYIVTEFTGTDDDVGEIPPFQNPLPTIISVTANVAHGVTATANAGPTDAGDVRSWWEVEMETGNVETLVRIDDQANNFSQNKNQIDTFTIPLGLNFDNKRIRFVIQSLEDPAQVWATLFFRMEGENFNNAETEVIIVPAPTPPSPPPLIDLTISLEDRAFVLEEEAQTQRTLVRVSNRSRYKLNRAFRNARRDPRLPERNLGGVEFGLLPVLIDFEQAGSDFQVHRVRQQDIGFLDLLAVRFYGAGFEDFWWAIAYANAIIDPESEMFVGQSLVIPSREAVTTFLTRKSGVGQGGG